ncbi:hypothetical protein BDR03DRAFT_1000673 [Suillus americanus]|nr:hypothetical protein BDR03DRAFT_1000673 [Suillus americanus]
MYWAIVNNRQEALWAFVKYISSYPPVCFYDMRLACMTVDNHALFMQLDLGYDTQFGAGWDLAHSADAVGVFLIEAHRGPPGCATAPAPLIIPMNQSPTCTLVPPGSHNYSDIKPGTDSEFRPQRYTDIQPGTKVGAVCEWLMDNNTIYVDSDGTLHPQR